MLGDFQRRKYGNRKVEIDGVVFDSKREAQRYQELCLLERAGEITDLVCHPRYDFVVNGVRLGFYKADFRYLKQAPSRKGQRGTFVDDVPVVEDVKSKPTKTTTYRLKRKLMKALYGIEIKEV